MVERPRKRRKQDENTISDGKDWFLTDGNTLAGVTYVCGCEWAQDAV